MATTAGSTRINIDLALNTRGFRPLGRINGQLGEFEKSLAASNARVLAFGASAGAILAVRKAFTATIKSAIEVEKSLKDINVILQVTSANLQKFGSNLFKIASDTGQSFKVAAEAATELARQGLGVEETLKRTKDALILARLAGMDAADAVNALTAALNTFTKVGLDSTTIINKLANVDAAFAVSSEDLAKALGRVGSAAVSAGVDLDQLLAIVTTAQQKTARGGAVIGNSFKTIFTRIQRPRVIKELENLGVQVRGLEGDTLPAIRVLENLAKQFDNLSQSQRAQISELVGGVFQVNVLKAALSDLSREQGIYNRALGISIGSSDQAIKRNEELNQTLAAQFQKTLNTFKEAAAEIGGLTFGPALENIFGTINKTFEAAAGDGALAKAGQGIAKTVFESIGKFIGGPGLVIIGAVLVKTFLSLATFAADAFRTLVGLNQNLQNQLNLQKQIFGVLSENPDLMNRIRAGTLSVEDAHQLVLQRIEEETTALDRQLLVSQRIAESLSRGGVVFSSDFGATAGGEREFRAGKRNRRGGRSGGYVPNFANEEVLGMMMNGYSSSQLANPKVRRDTIHNGRGGAFSAMTNGHESIVDFTNSKGKKATAVIPPKGSAAYEDFVKALSGGFIPNFAKISTAQARKMIAAGENVPGYNNRTDLTAAEKEQARLNTQAKNKKKEAAKKVKTPTMPFFDVGGHYGVLSLFGDVDNNSTITASTSGITAIKGAPAGVRPEKIQIGGFQQKSFLGKYNKKDSQTNNEYAALIKKHMAGPLVALTNEFFGPKLLSEFKPAGQIINKMRGNKGGALFPKGAEGSIFEASVNALTKNAIGFEKTLKGDPNATWDFEEAGFVGPKLRDSFGFSGSLKLADGKRSVSSDAMTSLANKVFTSVNKGGGGTGSRSIKNFIKDMNSATAAGGFIPSFSAVGQAIKRERAAGVPMNKIRVGSSRSLASGLNPMGLGVYNTRDEPSGLGQGIRRSMAGGFNPKTAGVPNFAPDSSLGKNTLGLLAVTTALQALGNFIQNNSESLDKGESTNETLVSAMGALQSAVLAGTSVAAVGSILPKRLAANPNLSMPSFLGGGGSRIRPRSRTAFSERLPGGSDVAGNMSARRFNVPATMFSGGVSYERGRIHTGGAFPGMQQGGAITNVQRTPSRFSAAMGRAGGFARRNLSRAGLNRAGMAMGGPAGVAAAGVGAFVASDKLINETFNSSFQELQAASKNFEIVAQESEKNIGKLTKFGESAEQAANVFNDSNATMGQVLQAQKQMSKAMRDVPSEIRQRISGLVDPAAIQAVVQEGIEKEQEKKRQAQTRKDTAETVRQIRKEDFGITQSFTDIFSSSETLQKNRDRDTRKARGVVSSAFGSLDPSKISGLSGENASKLMRDLQLVGTTGIGGDAQKRVEEQLGNLGFDQSTIDAFMKGMEEGSYSAEVLGEAISQEFVERRKAIQQEKELQPIREAMIKATRDQQKAIQDIKDQMVLEQKIRKETIKISSQAAKSFLSSTGAINLDTMNKQNQFKADNAAKFGDSISAANKAFGATNIGGALGRGVRNTLATASAQGVGSLDKKVVEAQTAALRAQAEKATAEERGPLEALATQLENLNATSDRLYKENVKNTYETTRIAAAQIAAARQAQRLKSFGGTQSITDPSSLNGVLAQLSGARQAGAIAQRAGSAVGVAGAQASRFEAIQQLLGGQLPPEMLAKARSSASAVKFSQIAAINQSEGLGMNRAQIKQIADEQAANLFKGEPLDRNNKNLESLNATIAQNNALLMNSRSNATTIGGMEMRAAEAQQARYAHFQQNMVANTRGSRREQLHFEQIAAQSRDFAGHLGQAQYGIVSPMGLALQNMGGDGPMTAYGAMQNAQGAHQGLQRTMSQTSQRTISNSSNVTNVYMNNIKLGEQNGQQLDHALRRNVPQYNSAVNRAPRGFSR